MKNNNKCKVNSCEKKIYSKKHELCTGHINRYYRTGKVGNGKIRSYKSHKPFNKDIT